MLRKITSFGLVLYVVLLLTQPCQDVFAGGPGGSIEPRSALKSSEPSESGCEIESCSPFCICSCCSLSVGHHDRLISLVPVSLEPIPFESSIGYENPYSKSYKNTVWQPPRS